MAMPNFCEPQFALIGIPCTSGKAYVLVGWPNRNTIRGYEAAASVASAVTSLAVGLDPALVATAVWASRSSDTTDLLEYDPQPPRSAAP
eukprot:4133280-Prymnesium_polylepis.1